jgi:hypothetical protein
LKPAFGPFEMLALLSIDFQPVRLETASYDFLSLVLPLTVPSCIGFLVDTDLLPDQ